MGKRIPVKAAESIKKHRYILHKISKASVKDRKNMLVNAPSKLFNVFKNICRLVANDQVDIGKAKKHRKFAQKVSSSKSSSIKAIVRHNGGALMSILSAVLPFIAPLVSKIFKK